MPSPLEIQIFFMPSQIKPPGHVPPARNKGVNKVLREANGFSMSPDHKAGYLGGGKLTSPEF